MNENLRLLMLEAGYAAPEIATRAQNLADLMIREIKILLECSYPPDDNIPVEEAMLCINTYFGTT